jgi:hypothetical protein
LILRSKFLYESLDRFRWIFCQLEVLRDCLPSSVRQTLTELPESLDETYERILKEIKKPNRAHARRVLQCLVVAIRPLRVAELAEVLTIDFGDVEGIPRSKPDWRWEEQELALLSACSSLIVIAQAGDSWVVQFSHFSVKEFLTAPRLAVSSGEVSNYHIDLEPAHAILAQVCLGVLLQIRDDVEGCTPKGHPLARYAAEHWAIHAQFGEVSSRLHKGMEYLFDANKPHFKVWLTLCNIDPYPNDDATSSLFALYGDKTPAAPLYYAALCGFHDLVEHLITKHPQDVNANGGYYVRPLVAALAGEHVQTADLLRHNGADPNVRNQYRRNPLHRMASSGTCPFPECKKEFGRFQELERHICDRHLPPYLYCEQPGCELTSSRLYWLKGHRASKHPGVPMPEQDVFTIYDAKVLARQVRTKEIGIEKAVHDACSFFEEKAEQMGKVGIWRWASD